MAEELGDVKGVGPSTLEKLEEGGITSLDDVANCNIEDLTSIGMSNSKAKRIIHEAKKSTVQIQTGLEVEEEFNNKRSISSGLSSLDEHTEGGYGQGEVIAIYGSDGSGKTQLCFKSAVNAVENDNGPVVWIETERERFRPNRIKNLASEDDVLEDIYRIRAYDLDTQYNAYQKVVDSLDDIGLIIIDSLTARFRLSQEFDGRSNLTARSSELGKHIDMIENMVDYFNCPCLLTGQVHQTPTQYDSGDKLWGGSLLKHTILFKIYMKNSSGDTHEVTVEQHPATGDNSFHINIGEDDVIEV